MLYQLLTDRPWEAAVDSDDIGSRDNGEVIVLRVSEAFQQVLASADEARLREIVQPWSQIEEFWGEGDPDELLPMMQDLSQLARTGIETARRLYCWICV